MQIRQELTMEEWVKTVPEKLRCYPLWESAYYRMAMYLYDLAWQDCELIHRDFRGQVVSRQLIRSIGSVCANIEEAFGRGVGSADYVRIMRIALGEARETQGWYYRCRNILRSDLFDRRIIITGQIIAMLINAVSRHFKALHKS